MLGESEPKVVPDYDEIFIEEDEDFAVETDDYDTWKCVKCGKEFVDPEDFPGVKIDADLKFEQRLYWLSVTEPVCSDCAIEAGIPPVDEG